jgi:hypothetical protein
MSFRGPDLSESTETCRLYSCCARLMLAPTPSDGAIGEGVIGVQGSHHAKNDMCSAPARRTHALQVGLLKSVPAVSAPLASGKTDKLPLLQVARTPE